MKHVLSTEWLASANRGHGHFPHYFWSSYEYLVYYQSEDSRAHLNSCTSPSPIMRTIKLESYFEHAV
jgi:hypothetical protein